MTFWLEFVGNPVLHVTAPDLRQIGQRVPDGDTPSWYARPHFPAAGLVVLSVHADAGEMAAGRGVLGQGVGGQVFAGGRCQDDQALSPLRYTKVTRLRIQQMRIVVLSLNMRIGTPAYTYIYSIHSYLARTSVLSGLG